MESNIKGLVSAGHEMASELKAECGAVDMRSVAKLISDLATQLEVQLVRANALAEDHQKAIESIKQADAAVKLAHEKFAALAAENAGLKALARSWANATDDRLFEEHGEIFHDSIESCEEELKAICPTTDAFLAEVRAQARSEGINYAAGRLAAAFNHGYVDKPLAEACDVVRMIMDTKEELANSIPAAADGLSGEYAENFLAEFAAQLRQGGAA